MRTKLLTVAMAVAFSGLMMSAGTAMAADAATASKPAAVATTSTTVLGAREYAIAEIAAFAASDQQDKLKDSLVKALEQGMTINELKAVLVQMYAYCGFPRSLTALSTFMALVNELKAAGIVDEQGREPSKLPEGTDMLAHGTATQTEVCGRPVKGPIYDFCPEIDYFLKDHLFGDVFANDLLSHKDREIATIAALSSLPAPIQLNGHYNISLNVGWTPEQLKDFANYVEKNVGSKAGEVAHAVLEQVLAAKAAK